MKTILFKSNQSLKIENIILSTLHALIIFIICQTIHAFRKGIFHNSEYNDVSSVILDVYFDI